MDQMHELILLPIVRFGFVGFSAVLLGIIVWLMKRLMCVLERNTEVIARNTEALHNLSSMTTDLLILNRKVHDKVISRPCIAKSEQKL